MSMTATTRSPATAGRTDNLASLGFAVAGVLFVIYPALRPYSSETGMAGARAFASWQWTAAHLCAILGFVLLTQTAARMNLGRTAPVAIGLGAALVLPYYGAEVFGLSAIGHRAVKYADPGVLDLTDKIRFGAPAMTLFALGLLALAAGGAAAGVALWRTQRAAGVMFAAGLVLYLPQFYFPPILRVAHGILLGLAMLGLAFRRFRTYGPPVELN